MSDDVCLPGMPEPPRPQPVEVLSADRRRTQRREDMLARGVHPTTKRRLLGAPGKFCGNCGWHNSHQRNKRYHKCDYRGMATHGAATDVRVGWPACELWKPEDES